MMSFGLALFPLEPSQMYLYILVEVTGSRSSTKLSIFSHFFNYQMFCLFEAVSFAPDFVLSFSVAFPKSEILLVMRRNIVKVQEESTVVRFMIHV